MKKSRSPCKSGQIRNPATGRCVKRNGSIGRKIRSRSKSKSPVRHRSRTPCKSDQIRNPDTGRCVKRKGSIGRKILGYDLYNPRTGHYYKSTGRYAMRNMY
jgi:hypothetical protein